MVLISSLNKERYMDDFDKLDEGYYKRKSRRRRRRGG